MQTAADQKKYPALLGIKKSYKDMTQAEKEATIKSITGYDSIDQAINIKSSKKNKGNLAGYWDTLEKVMTGQQKWDPTMQVSDAARDLIEQEQLKLEYGIPKKKTVVKPADESSEQKTAAARQNTALAAAPADPDKRAYFEGKTTLTLPDPLEEAAAAGRTNTVVVTPQTEQDTQIQMIQNGNYEIKHLDDEYAKQIDNLTAFGSNPEYIKARDDALNNLNNKKTEVQALKNSLLNGYRAQLEELQKKYIDAAEQYSLYKDEEHWKANGEAKKAYETMLEVTQGLEKRINETPDHINNGSEKAGQTHEVSPDTVGLSDTAEGNSNLNNAWAQSSVADHPRVQYAMPVQLNGKEKEDNRIARRNDFKKRIEELTGRPFVESLGIIQQMNQINETANMGLFGKPEIVDPRLDELNKLIDEAPAELFIPTEEEKTENIKNGQYAFAGGIGNGITLGLDELIDQGGEITPEQAKDLAKKGIDLLFVNQKDGKYYVPSKKELNEMMEKEHPIAYLTGNVLGELPVDIITGGISKGGGAVAKVIANVAPGVIENIISAINDKKDVGSAAFDILINAIADAAGVHSDEVVETFKKILEKSQDVYLAQHK